MVSLLDVNVLVALFDPAHIHHDTAHQWFEGCREQGWSTCPLTENGVVRVLSSPTYPGRRTTVADAVNRLEAFTSSGGHQFWEDSLTLRDPAVIDPALVGGARQVTDVYLLALAVGRDGRLASFDRRLNLSAVRRAGARHLVRIGS